MSENSVDALHQPICLKDYTPPAFLIETVTLDVEIAPESCLISARLDCRRNPLAPSKSALELDGDGLETLSVAIDGQTLCPSDYVLGEHRLCITSVPEKFVLETLVRIRPDANTQLSGLYRSRDGYFTQCEPHGFRRITWFIDRPDVMARYTVTLRAPKADFPVLLANGNPIAQGEAPNGYHFAVWEDPFPKPSYLFAMVAGKLDVLRDTLQTTSGRTVHLAIYVEPGKLDQCPHAMAALM